MFVVDLLHEVELGVWKALFIHLLRILESLHENVLHELDRRSAFGIYFQSSCPVQLVVRSALEDVTDQNINLTAFLSGSAWCPPLAVTR